jgi:hypothetical protein
MVPQPIISRRCRRLAVGRYDNRHRRRRPPSVPPTAWDVEGVGAPQTVSMASWNIDGWHTITDAQLDLLEASGAQLVADQEGAPDATCQPL